MGFCWIYKYRWLVLILSIALVSIAAFGAKELVQTADYKVYFDKGDRLLAASEKLGEDYSQSDNVLFVFAPKNGNVFEPKTLDAVKKLTEESWQIPLSTRVDSITNYQHSYAEGDDLIIEDLILQPQQLSVDQLDKIRSVALSEPNLLNRLIAQDGSVTAVNVTINFSDGKVDTETRDVVAYARQLIEKTKIENPEIDMYLTGIVLMNNAFPETSEKDGATLIPIMLLIILVGLFILLRSSSAVISSLVVILLSIGAAMGIAGWLGYKLNPISGAAPIIILTIAVADCVHILMGFIHNFRNEYMDKAKAMQESLEANVKPVLLTTLSTAIGFLSMNFSESPPFRELGNIAAAGIVTACFLSLTLLPAMINLLPVKRAPQEEKKANKGTAAQNPLLTHWMKSLSETVLRMPNTILIGGTILSLALAAAAFKNELNEDFVRYFDKSFDVRISTEFTLDNLTGISIVEYDLEAENKITAPDYLYNLEKFSQWLYQQPEVIHVNTFSDTVKRLNKNLNGDDPQQYEIPNNENLIAQYILLYESSLPFGLGITDRVKLDKSASRLTVTLNDVTNNELLAFEGRAQSWLQENLPSYMHSEGLGWSMMFGGVAQKNISSMLYATLFAVLFISAILVISFKSIYIGLLSLLPNLLPAVVALGIWGILVGTIGMAASIITALTFGIVVDDSIHFISRYVRNRRDLGMPVDEAIRSSFTTVGKAIFVTSIILTLGFALLATSGFKVNSTIGYLSATTIFVALLMDLFMLPAILIKLDRWLITDTSPAKEINKPARANP